MSSSGELSASVLARRSNPKLRRGPWRGRDRLILVYSSRGAYRLSSAVVAARRTRRQAQLVEEKSSPSCSSLEASGSTCRREKQRARSETSTTPYCRRGVDRPRETGSAQLRLPASG